MRIFLRLFKESVMFAMNALVVNRLRTFLSLLGVTIGIFAIISVLTMVDSMKIAIHDSIESLGNDVVFIQKWPWNFGSEYPWWKYISRPVPAYRELAEISERCESAEAAVFMFSVNQTVEMGSSSMENASVIAASHAYARVRNFELQNGRYFTEVESNSGSPVALIGANVALGLFWPANPIGKEIMIMNRKLRVIGVFMAEGESMIGNSLDNVVLIPVNYVRNIIDLRSQRLDPLIMVKAKEGVGNRQLKDELTGILRAIRKLRPMEDDNFALNETSLLSNGFESLFGAVSWGGFIIGLFSILVGGFGVANIMFVSVKERTPIIGVQKSLGAKNSFILFQFLSEAVILCIVGGVAGLVIIYLGTIIISAAADMEIVLTWHNILLGLGIATSIGLVSGIIPSLSASRLDPVEAIRAN